MTKKATGLGRFRIDSIALGDLRPHPTIQRPLRKSWVQYLTENFDPDAFGHLEAVEAKKGSGFWVFIGQHRMEAARSVFGNDQKVPVRVWDGISTEEQAKRFVDEITRLNPMSLDWWRMKKEAKDERVMAIDRILTHHGLSVSKARGPGTVQAVKGLEYIYKIDDGKEILDRTLSILINAFGRDPDAYDGYVLRGLGYLLHRCGKTINDDELSRKLARDGSSAATIPSKARDMAGTMGISVIRAVAEIMVRTYNKGKKYNLITL